MMDIDGAKQLFINEAQELLQTMESCLLEVESGEASIEQHIDAIFRAAHTIKGSAGLFGFDDIVAFTHSVESVLEQVRGDKLSFDVKLAALMLDCQQYMQALVADLLDAGLPTDHETGAQLLDHLDVYLNPQLDVPTGGQDSPESRISSDQTLWQINIRYGEEVFRDGMEPSSQLHFLRQLGEIQSLTVGTHFPPANFEPESCYLDLSLQFSSTASSQEIEDVFEFIQESSEVRLSVVSDRQEGAPDEGLCSDSDGIQKVLTETKKLSAKRSEIEHTLVEVLGEQELALDKGKIAENKMSSDLTFLKVDARKLDQLIQLIGELVTSGAANELLVQRVSNEMLNESFSAMVYLIEQIRDSALSLRMVQIGDSFTRLKRIVRDVSKELGKEVQLSIFGAETELDKSMVEKLSDPLMHIIRNALDHGIESKAQRLSQGKPEQGALKLNAYHEAGSVVIEISDDGVGLDAEKIRAKAIEKGLISPEASLTQDECFRLIFEPGFSTASAVTNLSGRGVGMDVVKRNIEELRGQISIDSRPNQGMTLRIRLPLTLAIIDGFHVKVADAHLVVPVNMVRECIEFDAAEISEERDYLNLRGEVLPFLRLRSVLGMQVGPHEREHIVVVQFGQNLAGLVVDELHGELQAVIKPLNPMFRAIRGIGGSTILGSGEVGFILDVPQLLELACVQETQQCSPSKYRSKKG
ncbi:chemotaxis protein CheA [Vibrio navarrensis]|uniref:Chemotaxis protein CheA n=1 Tax=Vibrio navarrensis TaxID=29495 RepID=A0AAI9CWY8_9VIBR|nr:chemotaxis protein CheA [Vibrio navarrensis]EKA5636943.1 chemotaxis protein CheA [Vibrio navarrensis]ELN6933736.1 chemotaxis protein CheA [Vibrio navarrensis]